MNYETRPRGLLRLVKPQQVRSYALAWIPTGGEIG